MSASTKSATITGEIDASGAPAEQMKNIPVGLLIAAFLVGNIVNPLFERTISPLLTSWSAARSEHDSAFLREFNTGLSGPQAMQQPYLIAYFSREYKLAEDTTHSVQNRCSVAQTILTYAQDPAISGHSAIIYAMPASVADDIAYAKSALAQPWYMHMFEHDPSCFVRIGQKIEQLLPSLLVADSANTNVIAGGSTVPQVARHHAHITHADDNAVDQAMQTVAADTHSAPAAKAPEAMSGGFVPQISTGAMPTAAAPPTTAGDWLYAPTFGNVIGNQMLKIVLQKTATGRRAVLHNTSLTGERGRALNVQLECVGCPPQLGLDAPRTIKVPSVTRPADHSGDRFVDIQTSLPITLRFHANEARLN